MNKTTILLNLKALVWSVYVSFPKETTEHICQSLRDGTIVADSPELDDTHLGKGLRIIMQAVSRPEDRALLAEGLQHVPTSEASIVFQNKVIEIGHYVTPVGISGLPGSGCGVVTHIDSRMVEALFLLPNRSLARKRVHPFELSPIYTLTVSD